MQKVVLNIDQYLLIPGNNDVYNFKVILCFKLLISYNTLKNTIRKPTMYPEFLFILGRGEDELYLIRLNSITSGKATFFIYI